MTRAGGRERRARIYPYVSGKVEKRLERYCDGSGVTQSAVVEAALRQHLDGTSDRTLLFRRLDRLGRAVARAQRDLELQAEAFAVFVKLWLAHTPSVAEEARSAARQTAEGRYRQYVKYVAEQFSGGKRFVDDLPLEELGGDADAATTSADPVPQGGGAGFAGGTDASRG